MKRFVLVIEETNGGYESSDTVVFSADSVESADSVAKNILIGWRSLGEWVDEDEEVADFGDGIEAQIFSLKEIPDSDYQVLRRYIADLTHMGSDEYVKSLE